MKREKRRSKGTSALRKLRNLAGFIKKEGEKATKVRMGESSQGGR